ncbi:MAG: D-alanyl-D-alanine carboxypeptidase [Lachnospiraceae bacterium]|nr:serine hydrolase [Lachnospiraceae bacterium]MDD7377812.1 serine hydrolase [Lachnospiraceae bacterium]MDY4616127.1 D-alanyl-D-alanine carboxypeptidase [Lachnospiraceae bacterium]
MKCTNKWRIVLPVVAVALLFCGCSKDDTTLENAYNVFDTSTKYGITKTGNLQSAEFFAKDLCVTEDENIGLEDTTESVAEGAGLFRLNEKEAVYKKNIYERLYPASTTKILTALIALEESNLDDVVTVSANAANQASDSSVCGLKEGDQISMRDLLYGLMMRSGNDAAIAIAEHISGSSEEFAVLMNAKAQSLGATNSHFVTPNGLHDEDHYTTVYDMYLIMNAAVQNETFVEILQTASYTTNYTDAAGNPVTQDWATTNKYLTGTEAVPEGVTVIGGKTGTTGEAKYCLVQYNQNASGEPMISIVFKADCRDNMYLLMSEILKNFSN